ncbi:MAG: anaerobic sulfatase maturase [Acidobacteria bacterium]|nr:anaerobic sulfatase maturase [Acidobacteriota bacterium]
MNKTHREFQVFVKPVGPRCNLHCRYCYYLSHSFPGSQSMSGELLEAYILQHIEACTEPVIQFSWHGGEPTLYGLDGFRRIVGLQKKHCPPDGVIVNGIQTNGILLDEAWCRFLAEEKFVVGLSLDGPERIHDLYRVTAKGSPTHKQVMRAYGRLRKHGVQTECLCVVHSGNVGLPLEVYEFFRSLEVPYLTFLPMVEPVENGRVSERTVPAGAWGEFLCSIFDVWLDRDIGRIKVQIFEEAARPAFGLEHTLCIFRKVCGGVPVLECNGDLYSCDHLMTGEHRPGNIGRATLENLLDSPQQQAFGRAKRNTLPRQCLDCAVLDMCNGGCPKNRFIQTADGEPGLNYLCSGYKLFFTHCRPFVAALAEVWCKRNAGY